MRFITLLVGLCWMVCSASASGNGTSAERYEPSAPYVPSRLVHVVNTIHQLIRDSFVGTRILGAGVGRRMREVCGFCKTSNLTVVVNVTAPVNGSGEDSGSCNTGNHSLETGSRLAALSRGDRTVAVGHLDGVRSSSKGLLLIRRYFIAVAMTVFKIWLSTFIALLISQLVYPLLLSYFRVDAPPARDSNEIEPYSPHPGEPYWWRTSNLGCPYEVLDVALTATQAEIRSVYRILSKQLHPDKHLGDKAAYEVMFRRIAQAYEALTNPASTSWHYGTCRPPAQ